MNKEKRARSSNFTKEEELLLIQEIRKFKHIIECKTTNKTSNSEKEETWQKILDSFNSKNIEIRSLRQVKSKYDNLKTKCRKEFAKYNSYLRGTGGGPANKDDLDPVIQAVIDLLNLKTVMGLSNTYDSDVIHTEDTDTGINNASTGDMVFEEVVVLTNDCGSDYSFEEKNIASSKQDTIDVPTFVTDNTSYSLDHTYGAPQKVELPSCNTPVNIKTIEMQASKKASFEESKETNWSKYVPSKLKQKMNGKLKNTVPNPVLAVKEQYYKRKLELLEQSVKEDNMERMKRIKREEEEHEAKMTIYYLDTELKK